MNDPEDRPNISDQPAPRADPPVSPPAPRIAGGPPPAEPVATWEDVVDPGPEPAPAPRAEPAPTPRTEPAAQSAPAPAPRPEPAAAGTTSWPEPVRARPAPLAPKPQPPAASEVDDDDVAEGDYDEYDAAATRWVSLLATVGTALIAIVGVQVVASLVEGLSLKSGQRVGVPDDLFHRLGYPFGGLGATALVFLVLGVVLVSMPSVLDELLSESQDRVVGISLIVAIVMGVLIAVGSLLAVRANLHEYAAKNVPVPSYVRVQFTNFLLGSLGAAALSLFAAIASMNERGRERI